MTDNTELLPCPFCGGAAELREGEECAYVQCLDAKFHRGPFIDGDNAASEEAVRQWNTRASTADLQQRVAELEAENARLRDCARQAVINAPETADFMAGVPLEAAHQRERWGADHDAGKTPFDWFWLIGYLAQKAAQSAVAGDTEKALHHTISTAAALANWHAAIAGKDTRMRPGIELPRQALSENSR